MGGPEAEHQFFNEEVPWFLRPLTDLLPFDIPTLPALGVFAALFEALFAIELLTKRFRAFALSEALLMHALIFFLIGPFRNGWNNSAWIWGQTMAAPEKRIFKAVLDTICSHVPDRSVRLFVTENRDGSSRNRRINTAAEKYKGRFPLFLRISNPSSENTVVGQFKLSCSRKRASRGLRALDSRFRGNDDQKGTAQPN